ncbi:hypothetical protein D3C72_1520190 [compost metagenome]
MMTWCLLMASMISSRLPDTGSDSGNVMRSGAGEAETAGGEAGVGVGTREGSGKRESEEDIGPHYP